MCSVTNYNPEVRIATEDIVCYKHVNVEKKSYLLGLIKKYKIISIYTRFEYELNKLYKTKLDPFKKIVNKYYSCCGFYSYEKNWNYNVKCIIPKGSKYYLTEENVNYPENKFVYISDQIKIVKILR